MRYCIWVLLVVCCAGWALSPRQVLVVANTNSEESVALAKHYLKARGIPGTNFCRIATATGYHCSRAEYETQIRVPIRDFLTKKKLVGNIRCIVLMWGVPVKIGWQPFSTAYPALEQAFDAQGTVALQALTQLEQLLGTIGTSFPPAKSEDLTRLGDFFDKLPAVTTVQLPSPDDHVKAEAYSARADALSKALMGVTLLIKVKRAEVAKLADPAQRALAERQLQAVSLVLHGRFSAATDPAGSLAEEYVRLRTQQQQEAQRLQLALRWQPDAARLRQACAAVDAIAGKAGVAHLYITEMNPSMYRDAAVDSDLALLWHGNYPLGGMRPNPLYWKTNAEAAPEGAVLPKGITWPAVYMTARIDGPTAADAKRLIDDAVAVERIGLSGTVYLDAGGKYPNYDVHYKTLATFLAENTKQKVVLDEQQTLFAPGNCPDAALYTGWYSLCNYIPAFTWNRGAVGFHLASFEAADLRDPKSTQWCVKMIQKGVAATLGPVSEPYLSAFPLPEEFFPLLLTGRFTLAECYWRTIPQTSWQMTLIGDPLYTPYKRHPAVAIEALPAGLALKSLQESSGAARK